MRRRWMRYFARERALGAAVIGKVRRSAAGVAAGLALIAPAAAWAHHVASIVIVVPASGGIARPIGPPVQMPVDVLDSAPEAMSGALVPGAVIAQHAVRAVDARVLTSPVSKGVIEIPAGTVLAKVVNLAPRGPADPAFPPLWCSTRPVPAFHASTLDCLQDEAGSSGAFTRFMTVALATPDATLAVGWLSPGVVDIAPASYREAKPEERPTGLVGYRFCAGDGDGAAIPYRFTTVVMQEGRSRGWRGAERACPFGEWPNPGDKTLLQVDGLKVRVEGTGAAVRYAVLDRIAPGPIAGIVGDRPIRSAAAPTPAEVGRIEARAARPLVAAGLPEELAPGVRAHGEVIAQIPVVHGVTGVLKTDVLRRGLFTSRFNAGQYVYGVPMKGSDGVEGVTWCAPRAAEGEPGRYATVCFPEAHGGHIWVQSFEPLLSLGLTWPAAYLPDVVGFSVERRPASLGADMKLTYVFDQWRTLPYPKPPLLAASIGVEMRVNGRMSPIDHIYVLVDKDGVARLPLLDGLVTLSPVAKGAEAVPPAPGLTSNRAEVSAFLAAVDRSRVKVEVKAPGRPEGALPITGLVLMRPEPPMSVPPHPAAP